MPRLHHFLTGLLILATVCPVRADQRIDGVTFFEKRIRPLLVSKCYACHSQKAGKRSGGLVLDRPSSWSKGGDSGPAIVPGDPGASLLIRAVRYSDDALQMPPKQRLSKKEVALLEAWVKAGAVAPRVEAKVAEVDPSDPVAGKSHWAFRAVAPGSLPAVRNTAWPRRGLDHYVLAKLESRSLEPAPDAARVTLLRRLTIQLTGLPPTPEQAELFLNDRRPDALARLVDRLLMSPQYGERWGRHWLDLARYADSNGLDENFLFRQAWRYRNWVINAVNADTPFDRFLLEQIAGDLIPASSIAQRDKQRLGTGFLVVGPKVLLGVPRDRQRMEIADEQVETIGRAVLAQTFGCARCHDHKFDPFPTADYYSLAGVFTSTVVMETRSFGGQRYMERLVGLGPDGERLDDEYERYFRELPKGKKRIEQAKKALELIKKKDESQLTKLAKASRDALADAARNTKLSTKKRLAAQQAFLVQLVKSQGKQPPVPPRGMIAADVGTPADEAIRMAGQFDRKGKVVARGVPQVLSTSPVSISRQSGRAAVARWLTDVDGGAGRLAARVLVNRIWQHLIGVGIVRTTDNFGRRGEQPSHPELLDYLAQRLIDSGWSVKSIVREIALSRTFAMSSAHQQTAHQVDPENRLLWRGHRRRLDPESLRDSLLSLAGQLDLQPMKSSVTNLGVQATGVGINARRRTDFPCRSVYLPVIRNDLPELFDVFDFADPHRTTGTRPETTVAPQGLFMLNDDQVMGAAQAVARRALKIRSAQGHDAAVDWMFRWILASNPESDERERVTSFLVTAESQLKADNKADYTQQAWTMAAHAMFASSRFQYLE